MDLFGQFVPGDEFVGSAPGNSGIARLVETNDSQSPVQLQWAPRNEKAGSKAKATDSIRRVTTLQNLYDGLCGDYVSYLTSNIINSIGTKVNVGRVQIPDFYVPSGQTSEQGTEIRTISPALRERSKRRSDWRQLDRHCESSSKTRCCS